MNYDGDISDGLYLHGDPTGVGSLPAGSAVYAGTMSGYRYFIDPCCIAPNPADRAPEYERVFGDVTLTANFASGSLTGSVGNIRTRPRTGPLESHAGAQFTFAGGSIDQNSFTADVTGTGYAGGFVGDLEGAFYGAGAEEAGGVISASRGQNDVFLGHIGGKR